VSADWRDNPIPLEEWEAKCAASSHVRPHEKLRFSTDERSGVISCSIEVPQVFLGSYFTKPQETAGRKIQAGTGWCHE